MTGSITTEAVGDQGSQSALLYGAHKRPVSYPQPASDLGALGGTRTPNLLIRSQMLYPLSYERSAVPR